jgi:hypothetical protein
MRVGSTRYFRDQEYKRYDMESGEWIYIRIYIYIHITKLAIMHTLTKRYECNKIKSFRNNEKTN